MDSIAIIKSAVGGTTVAFDWNPTAPTNGQKLYPRTLKLIRESLQDLDRRGRKYQLEGVLWHQGENDMLDPRLNRQYAQGLRIPMKADTCSDSYRTLIRRYRTVVGAKRRSEVSNKELSDMRQENRT